MLPPFTISHRTSELTRRRKPKRPPPHRASCERRSRRSRPTIWLLCAAPSFKLPTKRQRIEPLIIWIKFFALFKIFPPQSASHPPIYLMRKMGFVFNSPFHERHSKIPMFKSEDVRPGLERTNECDTFTIPIPIENRSFQRHQSVQS